MTDTTPAPAEQPKASWLARLRNLLHHPTEDHTKSVVSELLDKVHSLESEIVHVKADLAAVVKKDGPDVVHAAEEVAHDAAPVVAEAEADVKAAGAP